MNEKILSLALRPQTLSAMWGQESTVKSIRALVAKRMPSVWMFSGQSGCGKTTISQILAVSYQCTHMKLWGDPCAECWRGWSGYAIHEVNASDDTGVEAARKMIEIARFKPTNGGKRVIIMGEAHKLSDAAQKCLLDPTEKAGGHVVWVFNTTEPNKIIDTLRKRAVKYVMKSLGISGSEEFLKRAATKAAVTRPLEPLFEQCHLMQVAAPRDLLMALEKYASGSSAVESVAGVDDSGIDSLRICKAVTSGKWGELRDNLKDATPEQARYIRASVSGWLRGCLIRASSPLDQERAAVSMLELAQFPFDDSAMLHWLWGVLWRVCKRYREVPR